MFLLALPTPVAYFEPCLGGRILGPRAPLGEMNTHCNSSSFLKGVMKMDDIGPFGEHDKMDEQPDTGETNPYTPPVVIERQT